MAIQRDRPWSLIVLTHWHHSYHLDLAMTTIEPGIFVMLCLGTNGPSNQSPKWQPHGTPPLSSTIPCEKACNFKMKWWSQNPSIHLRAIPNPSTRCTLPRKSRTRDSYTRSPRRYAIRRNDSIYTRSVSRDQNQSRPGRPTRQDALCERRFGASVYQAGRIWYGCVSPHHMLSEKSVPHHSILLRTT